MTLFLERRELLARFRAGERRALEETYRHYAPMLATFLSRGFSFNSGDRTLRFAGYPNAFDLDNALAETFVRAFREPARLGYDGLQPYKNYLLTIARNLVVDELRRAPLAREPPAEEEVALDASAEEDLLAKELAELYARFVGRLSESDRAFFHARFEDARTQIEAGRAAGLSQMQARTLEKRLRKRFLSFLQASGYLEGYGRLEGGAG